MQGVGPVDLIDILGPRLLRSRLGTQGNLPFARALRLLHALRAKRPATPHRNRYVLSLGFDIRTQIRCDIERP
jgi:hypothetical protein